MSLMYKTCWNSTLKQKQHLQANDLIIDGNMALTEFPQNSHQIGFFPPTFYCYLSTNLGWCADEIT